MSRAVRSSGRRRGALLAVLLACCIRILNPPGVMLAFSDGIPSWVPCVADSAPQSSTHFKPHTAGHHAGSHHDSGSDPHAGHHAAGICPFAIAHAAGLQSPPPTALVLRLLSLPGGATTVDVPAPRSPPLRHRAPRGPPFLA